MALSCKIVFQCSSSVVAIGPVACNNPVAEKVRRLAAVGHRRRRTPLPPRSPAKHHVKAIAPSLLTIYASYGRVITAPTAASSSSTTSFISRLCFVVFSDALGSAELCPAVIILCSRLLLRQGRKQAASVAANTQLHDSCSSSLLCVLAMCYGFCVLLLYVLTQLGLDSALAGSQIWPSGFILTKISQENRAETSSLRRHLCLNLSSSS